VFTLSPPTTRIVYITMPLKYYYLCTYAMALDRSSSLAVIPASLR
jgi:hypothetical protein